LHNYFSERLYKRIYKMSELAIICVDDDVVTLSRLEMEIKAIIDNTYFLRLVENGKEALEIYKKLSEKGYKIALIISDYMMPGIKGDELLVHIHEISPQTFKIMLTGQTHLKKVSQTMQAAHLYRYILKPWHSDDLRLTIKEALHCYHQDKEIMERTYKLQKSNEALIKLNQEKNEFLGIAAHDLKNPLCAIQGWAEMIASDCAEMEKDEIVDVTNLIGESSRQMFELISNLLDVNAIESGKINTSLTQMDLFVVMQKLVVHYTKQAQVKEILLHFQPQENQSLVFADKNIVHQILDNLISNAIKYSPYGTHVYIRMSQNDKMVRCEIQDEGPGLNEIDQKKLFGKFTRLTPKPTGTEHSTGLGLFIVKKLVNAINGKVWCESELGKGTRFFVEFQFFL